VKLAQLEAAFHALATRGAAHAIEAAAFLVGTAELPASDRIGIYADMYSWRLADALREDYPTVAAILGDERFLVLAEAYTAECPSNDPDLGQFGRNLVRYLRRYPAPDRPDLADVATLELERTEVFFEASSTVVQSAALASLSAGEFVESRLELVPSLRVLQLDHDVRGVWRAAQANEPVGTPVPEATALVVWRSGFDVFHTRLEHDEAQALAAADRGESLGVVCAAFSGRDDPANGAFAALVSWFDEGWIASIRTPNRARTYGGHDQVANPG
jgi:hypothetical protein